MKKASVILLISLFFLTVILSCSKKETGAALWDSSKR
jgi:hypothetical protein